MRQRSKVPSLLSTMEDAEDNELIFIGDVHAVDDYVRQMWHCEFPRSLLAARMTEAWQGAE